MLLYYWIYHEIKTVSSTNTCHYSIFLAWYFHKVFIKSHCDVQFVLLGVTVVLSSSSQRFSTVNKEEVELML